MDARDQVLVAVDGSEASERVARYVGHLFARAACRVFWMHVLDPVPPALLEFGGEENPQKERQRERALDERQRRWIAASEATAAPVLDRMAAIAEAEGLSRDRIEKFFWAPIPEESITDVILRSSREHDCGTIVVGRESHPWHKKLFQRHVADELVKKAEDVAICVVV